MLVLTCTKICMKVSICVSMYVCIHTYIQEGTIFMLICAHNVFQYTLYYMCVLLRKESAGPLFYPAATVAYL